MCPRTSIHFKGVFVCIISKPLNLAVTYIITVNPRAVRLVLHVAHREKNITNFSSAVLIKAEDLDKISLYTRISLGRIGTGHA